MAAGIEEGWDSTIARVDRGRGILDRLQRSRGCRRRPAMQGVMLPPWDAHAELQARRRPARAAVCRILCLIFCLAYVES